MFKPNLETNVCVCLCICRINLLHLYIYAQKYSSVYTLALFPNLSNACL